MARKAFVTLLSRDIYLAGVLVVHQSLSLVGSRYPLVVMTTPGLSSDARAVLAKRNVQTVEVDSLLPPGYTVAAHDARFMEAWSKLRCFYLYEYDRIVLLDADMLIRRNMDELFDIELPPGWIAAAHACACNPMKYEHYPKDWIPANCAHTIVTSPTADPPIMTATSPAPHNLLNSGLVVLEPSKKQVDDFTEYLRYPDNYRDFRFADQDLLSTLYAGRWKPLNWYYNALKTLRVIHTAVWSDDEVRCVHYILAEKPWSSRQCDERYAVMHGWWWDAMDAILEDMKVNDLESYKFVSGVLDRLDTSKGKEAPKS